MDSAPVEHRILLVEDEAVVGRMVERMLTDLGYAVVGPATDIKEAMTMIGVGGIDAAVLDINLDGVMSFPVADELTHRGIPFVFSTGYGPEILSNGYPAFALLKKPFRRAVLEGALQNLLAPMQSKEAAD